MTNIPIGPHFDYAAAPGLFLGRSDLGPLDVVWDTSVLLDYVDYGADLWEGRKPKIADEEQASEIEALGVLIQLWTLRDIQFRILPETIEDARSMLSTDRLSTRVRALVEFAAALNLGPYTDEDSSPSAPMPTGANLDHLWRALPPGMDSLLVQNAYELGAHVFLTRDRGILRTREAFEEVGLLVASPLDLVVELAACGAILCAMNAEYLYWPVPDLQRVTHLINALGSID